jgi:hypothetical protein
MDRFETKSVVNLFFKSDFPDLPYFKARLLGFSYYFCRLIKFN